MSPATGRFRRKTSRQKKRSGSARNGCQIGCENGCRTGCQVGRDVWRSRRASGIISRSQSADGGITPLLGAKSPRAARRKLKIIAWIPRRSRARLKIRVRHGSIATFRTRRGRDVETARRSRFARDLRRGRAVARVTDDNHARGRCFAGGGLLVCAIVLGDICEAVIRGVVSTGGYAAARISSSAKLGNRRMQMPLGRCAIQTCCRTGASTGPAAPSIASVERNRAASRTRISASRCICRGWRPRRLGGIKRPRRKSRANSVMIDARPCRPSAMTNEAQRNSAPAATPLRLCRSDGAPMAAVHLVNRWSGQFHHRLAHGGADHPRADPRYRDREQHPPLRVDRPAIVSRSGGSTAPGCLRPGRGA